MGIVVKDLYLPGFTEPTRNEQIEKYLTERGYGESQCGGAEIAHYFHSLIASDPEVHLVAGAEGFTNLQKSLDARNLIVASCAKHNCMSIVWWMVEREGEGSWTLYAGSWNEQLGFMVLSAPGYHPVPLVWLTADLKRLKELLDLRAV